MRLRCGADDVFEHAQDVGLELFDVDAIEHGAADAHHARADFGDGHLCGRTARQSGDADKDRAMAQPRGKASRTGSAYW